MKKDMMVILAVAVGIFLIVIPEPATTVTGAAIIAGALLMSGGK